MKLNKKQTIEILSQICYYAQEHSSDWADRHRDANAFQHTSYTVACFIAQNGPQNSWAKQGVEWDVVLDELMGKPKSEQDWRDIIMKKIDSYWAQPKANHKIILSKEEARDTETLLNKITDVPKDSLVWEKWVEFPHESGATYAIQLEIISSLDPSSEPCWSQAGLFEYDEGQWCEVEYSEVSDSILGEWEFDEAVLLVEGEG